ncbi:SEC-C domain-containing protein [bacterium]|nr:SEC-C domain-containing protein [bacterium]
MVDLISGKKKGKLGTKTNPAQVSVQNEKRSKEVEDIFAKNGWEFEIEIEPDKEEEISDLNRLLKPPQPVTAEKKIGPNEPCPCGSGKKLKKCCKK